MDRQEAESLAPGRGGVAAWAPMPPLRWLVVVAFVQACGGPSRRPPRAAPPTDPGAELGASDGALASAPAHAIPRSAIRAAVAQGLGVFLQHLELDDEPVRVGGRFHGFRIAALNDPSFWRGIDLQPGDVVTSVNGFPIERPEEAQKAFEALAVASELRVAVERDGRRLELVMPIVDDR
jgi:general secretion pathway protein C